MRKACSDGAEAVHKFEPYYIVTPNSDVRITVVADNANTDISGYIAGVLAVVV